MKRALFLTLIVLAITVPGITTLPPIDRDESRYVQASKQMVESGDYIDIRFQDEARYKKPIGIYWLQATAVKTIFGGAQAPIWVYRLVSISGAVAATLAVFWTGTRLFGRTAGLAAGLVLSAILGVAFEARIAKTDAMLLAFSIVAQGALAQIYVAARNSSPVRPALSWLFWIALGFGILIKGPITPLLSALTVATLCFLDKDRRWLRELRSARGLVIAMLITMPWLVAISSKSGGAFWHESVGNDLLGKVVSGQESHGAPPGYYILTYALYVWPFGPLMLAAGIAALKHLRSDPRLLFLFSWYVPFWLFFELLPTKLPHYVLPVYPALALVAGWAVAETASISSVPTRRWETWLYWLSVAGAAVVSIGLSALAVAGPLYLGGGVQPAGIVVAVAVFAAAYFALPGREGADLRRMGSAVVAAGIAYGLLFTMVVPSLETIWLTPRIAAAVKVNKPCTNSRLASAGYHEPSLVFLVGTKTLLTDVEGAADHLLSDPVCALALVPASEAARLAERASAGGKSIVPVALIEGVNYSKGKRLSLRLFRIEDRSGVRKTPG
ncbi:ArnT family glycosyltransferase [Chelativorans alearense]|uniref:ArnT family glycosyltransferase n=1 Tax=Chelativorans alearense TaxID=2681495 RepID=UPI0013D289C3|nr:glycosyltransferase family 39 protein [Chelativorans alearense]